jgi:hypothetical protein
MQRTSAERQQKKASSIPLLKIWWCLDITAAQEGAEKNRRNYQWHVAFSISLETVSVSIELICQQ